MAYFVAIIMLTILTVEDIKEKEISVTLAILFIVSGLALALVRDNGFSVDIIYSILPGVFLLAVSIITNGKIGAGDGLALIGLGAAIGALGAIVAFVIGILLAAGYGAAKMLRKKIRGTAALPFLPFLLTGTIFVAVGT